jgi:hypothetical protein
LNAIHRHSSSVAQTLDEGIILLAALRQEVYEDMNQIQHEFANIKALEWIVANGLNKDLVWYWNPTSVGGGDEPDLRGINGGNVVVSAEITASANPKGSIDRWMAKTLAKLSGMEGVRYYFVNSTVDGAKSVYEGCESRLPDSGR